MDYMTLTVVTIGVAAVVVLGFFLISYMSNLVKNAYQIKVEMRNDMEANFRKIEDELTKKSKWMRAELGEDVSKMKSSVETENDRRLTSIETRLRETVAQLDELVRGERQEIRQSVESIQRRLGTIEQDITNLKDEAARRAAIARSRKPEDLQSPTPRTPAKPAAPAARPAAAAPAAAPGAPAPQPAPAAAAPAPAAEAPPAVKPGTAQRIELIEFDD
ncbi:hypothetical protein [Novispirillum itersonii]|uniref:TolA-binding protein n=1 Tax=Novispirillum itersonii TaxID=189 RepID=A0A7W9ZHU5_NOVIT|nr:hypothetical protein [Novispirillum itersonii]MBB6211746.1 TolA-binding protein [Novispirillum itersonii]